MNDRLTSFRFPNSRFAHLMTGLKAIQHQPVRPECGRKATVKDARHFLNCCSDMASVHELRLEDI